MVTASPPVSPSVVARIFMIQKPRVTSGTLLGVGVVPTRASIRDRVAGAPAEVAVVKRHGGRGGAMMAMGWQFWALLAAVFAALTAILAKVGVEDVNPDIATFIRTFVVLI